MCIPYPDLILNKESLVLKENRCLFFFSFQKTVSRQRIYILRQNWGQCLESEFPQRHLSHRDNHGSSEPPEEVAVYRKQCSLSF